MQYRIIFGLLSLALVNGRLGAAENEGQGDLDRATEIKLVAENVDDLNLVINLTQSAITKGLDPKAAEYAKKLLASTLIQRAGMYSKAILEQSPPDPRWARLRTAALVDLERALKSDDSVAEAHYLVARLNSLQGGDRKRAGEACEKALKLAGDDNRMKSKALVLRAGLTDDDDKRRADLDEAVKAAPDNVEALRTRGLLRLLEDKAELALADLDAAVKLDAKNVDVQEARGLTLIAMKRYEDAVKTFDEVVKLAPDLTLPYLHRARARSLNGDHQGALEDLDKSLDKEPDNPAILLIRARVHQQLGNKDKAREDVEAALKEQPGSPSLGLRAFLAAGSGEIKQAIADAKELQKVAPNSADLALQLGLLYSTAKQPRKSIEAYDAAIKLDDKSFHAYRGRGDAYLNTGRQAEAIADYEAAMKLKPDDSGVLNNFAWVLATSPDDKLRNAKRALELAKEACRLTDNKQAHILSTLAAAYAENGDWESALKWSEQSVKTADEEGEHNDQLNKEVETYKRKEHVRELIDDADVPDEEIGKKKDKD